MSFLIESIQKKRLALKSYRRLESTFKEKKTQAYTMFILSLFTVSFFGFFALKPTVATIVKLKRQIEDSKEIDRRLSDKINQLIAAQAEYEIIAPFVPKVKSALPEKHQYIKLLSDMEDIRASSHATISSVKIDEVPIETAKAGLLNIKLEAKGQFVSLEELLNRIMANERLLTISEMRFSKSQGPKEGRQLGLSLNIEAPYAGSRSASERSENRN